MLKEAIEIRVIHVEGGKQYEVFDSDTGTSLGIYDDIVSAENERQRLKGSEQIVRQTDKDEGEADA